MILHIALATLLSAPTPPVGTLVSTPSYQGVIVKCGMGSRGCWEPTTSQIATLESTLRRTMKRPAPVSLQGLLHPLREYRRQYLGCTGSFGKAIMVVGYHRSQDVVSTGQWLKAIITVHGGGGNFSSGRFLVVQRSFDSLAINAPE